MDTSEINSSIQPIWILKNLFGHLLLIIILLPIFIVYADFSSPNLIFILSMVMVFVLYEGGLIAGDWLRWKSFRFSFSDSAVSFIQRRGPGLRPELNLAYSQIRNIYTNQGWFENIFGLGSLTIEFMPEDINDNKEMFNERGYYGVTSISQREMLAFMGNRIHLPGLKKEKAKELRNFLLQKTARGN